MTAFWFRNMVFQYYDVIQLSIICSNRLRCQESSFLIKWYIFTILQNILTFSRELYLYESVTSIVIYILNSINYQFSSFSTNRLVLFFLSLLFLLVLFLLFLLIIIIIIIIMYCCCCCYTGKSFCHSWYIQYARFIDIVLISLLFSQFSSLHALWP